jgi:hypothetical protein
VFLLVDSFVGESIIHLLAIDFHLLDSELSPWKTTKYESINNANDALRRW